MTKQERLKQQKEQQLKQLGQKIKTLRIKKGLTVTEFSVLANKDYQSIQRLEKGDVNPSYIYLCQIASGLDVTISELLASDNPKPKKK